MSILVLTCICPLTASQGSGGRMIQQQDPTRESFYASLIEVPQHTPVRDDRRSRRQSRVSREIVSQGKRFELVLAESRNTHGTTDPTASATPTREWREQLAHRLAHGPQWAYSTSPLSPPSRSSSSAGGSTDYARTRRRLDWPPIHQNWDNLYTMSDSTRKWSFIGNHSATYRTHRLHGNRTELGRGCGSVWTSLR